MGGGEMAANLRTRMLLIRLLVAFVVAVAAVAAAAAGGWEQHLCHVLKLIIIN